MLWEEHRSAVCHPGPVPTDSEEARACHCDADSDDSSLSSARTGTHCDIINWIGDIVSSTDHFLFHHSALAGMSSRIWTIELDLNE